MAPDDLGMQRYFRKIADFLTGEFCISRAEAIARLNAAFRRITFQPYPDIMCLLRGGGAVPGRVGGPLDMDGTPRAHSSCGAASAVPMADTPAPTATSVIPSNSRCLTINDLR